MTPPALTEFRVEIGSNGIAHLIFDSPGRTMNVFSENAIADVGAFAAWLPDADVRGVLLRSGKDNAFCAGADLTELGMAYDMIMAASDRARFDLAYEHFAPIGRAFRALERAGKPVAAAIEGLALGGGCEFALAAHYRVLADDAKAALGLPETLVGLLPGGGGTQRLPRLCGIETALPVLLDGKRLGGAAALQAGLVNQLVKSGDAVAAAEAWLLSDPDPVQPWDRPEWSPLPSDQVTAAIAPSRLDMLTRTLGHYPAMTAVLDCVEFGLPQSFDGGYRTEMSVFSDLIQRAEARNMIQTQFLARTEYERLARKAGLPDWVTGAVQSSTAAFADVDDLEAAGAAGFGGAAAYTAPLRTRTGLGYWVDGDDPLAERARVVLAKIGTAVVPFGTQRTPAERRLIDYAITRAIGYPAYLGGPLAFAER